jgi:hypothetical protein
VTVPVEVSCVVVKVVVLDGKVDVVEVVDDEFEVVVEESIPLDEVVLCDVVTVDVLKTQPVNNKAIPKASINTNNFFMSFPHFIECAFLL